MLAVTEIKEGATDLCQTRMEAYDTAGLRVLIVDDHAIVRRGIMKILEGAFKQIQCGESADADQASRLAAEQAWDLAVLDISLPGRGGLELLKDFRTAYPNLPILVLSIYPEEHYAVRALKAGAAGYLTKEAAPEELVRAVRQVLTGGKYVTDSLAQLLAARLRTGLHEPVHDALSNREYQVLRLIAQGLTVSEIAQDLSLSVKTVSTYRTRVLQKTGMKSNAELMRYALDKKLVL